MHNLTEREGEIQNKKAVKLIKRIGTYLNSNNLHINFYK